MTSRQAHCRQFAASVLGLETDAGYNDAFVPPFPIGSAELTHRR